MIDCAIIGDSLATYAGVGQYLDCRAILAEKGRHSAYAAALGAPSASIVIISLGSNDEPTAELRFVLASLRATIAGRVIWILPHERRRAAIVQSVADEWRDDMVTFTAGRDGVHPASYRALAEDIRALLPRD